MNAVQTARADYMAPGQVVAVVAGMARELREPVVLLIRWDGTVSVRQLFRASLRDLQSRAYTGTWRHPVDKAALQTDIDERIADILAGWFG